MRLRLSSLLRRARKVLGDKAVLEFSHEVVWRLACKVCSRKKNIFRPLDAMAEKDFRCPGCGETADFESFHTISGGEPFLGRPLSSLGLPPFGALAARAGTKEIWYVIAGDARRVLGDLYG